MGAAAASSAGGEGSSSTTESNEVAKEIDQMSYDDAVDMCSVEEVVDMYSGMAVDEDSRVSNEQPPGNEGAQLVPQTPTGGQQQSGLYDVELQALGFGDAVVPEDKSGGDDEPMQSTDSDDTNSAVQACAHTPCPDGLGGEPGTTTLTNRKRPALPEHTVVDLRAGLEKLGLWDSLLDQEQKTGILTEHKDKSAKDLEQWSTALEIEKRDLERQISELNDQEKMDTAHSKRASFGCRMAKLEVDLARTVRDGVLQYINEFIQAFDNLRDSLHQESNEQRVGNPKAPMRVYDIGPSQEFVARMIQSYKTRGEAEARVELAERELQRWTVAKTHALQKANLTIKSTMEKQSQKHDVTDMGLRVAVAKHVFEEYQEYQQSTKDTCAQSDKTDSTVTVGSSASSDQVRELQKENETQKQQNETQKQQIERLERELQARGDPASAPSVASAAVAAPAADANGHEAASVGQAATASAPGSDWLTCLKRFLCGGCAAACGITGTWLQQIQGRGLEMGFVNECVGHGLRSIQDIEPNGYIVVYGGELLSREEAERRNTRTHFKALSRNGYVVDGIRVKELPSTHWGALPNSCLHPNAHFIEVRSQSWPRGLQGILPDIVVLQAGSNGIKAGQWITLNYAIDDGGADVASNGDENGVGADHADPTGAAAPPGGGDTGAEGGSGSSSAEGGGSGSSAEGGGGSSSAEGGDARSTDNDKHEYTHTPTGMGIQWRAKDTRAKASTDSMRKFNRKLAQLWAIRRGEATAARWDYKKAGLELRRRAKSVPSNPLRATACRIIGNVLDSDGFEQDGVKLVKHGEHGNRLSIDDKHSAGFQGYDRVDGDSSAEHADAEQRNHTLRMKHAFLKKMRSKCTAIEKSDGIKIGEMEPSDLEAYLEALAKKSIAKAFVVAAVCLLGEGKRTVEAIHGSCGDEVDVHTPDTASPYASFGVHADNHSELDKGVPASQKKYIDHSVVFQCSPGKTSMKIAGGGLHGPDHEIKYQGVGSCAVFPAWALHYSSNSEPEVEGGSLWKFAVFFEPATPWPRAPHTS